MTQEEKVKMEHLQRKYNETVVAFENYRSSPYLRAEMAKAKARLDKFKNEMVEKYHGRQKPLFT